MRIFISHSHEDKAVVQRIVARLEADGHDVWVDTARLKPGDNFLREIEQGIETADVLLVIVGRNSFRSQWVQREFSAMALHDLSTGEPRIIPVKIDQSEVPAYLATRLYVDLSDNFDSGLNTLVNGLRALSPGTPVTVGARETTLAEGRIAQVATLRECLCGGRLTLVCGCRRLSRGRDPSLGRPTSAPFGSDDEAHIRETRTER